MLLMTRYDSRAAGGPMRTASSANRTNGASTSASEYTATVAMPISRHVRMTRSAISPRFAIRTLSISVFTSPRYNTHLRSAGWWTDRNRSSEHQQRDRDTEPERKHQEERGKNIQDRAARCGRAVIGIAVQRVDVHELD